MKSTKKTKPVQPHEVEALKAELAKQLAESSLIDFIRQGWHVLEPEQKFCDNWHLEALCLHLEAVADGRIPQIVINVPPGTMKSLAVGVFFPAWVWIKRPEARFMHSSYAESLSKRDAGKCRDLIRSEWYQARWPRTIRDDIDAIGKFQNDKKGWRMVASISGKGTGEHPDFNIADDPHNVVRAESEVERAEVVNWIDSTFCTRGVARGCRRIVVMQRLHSLDASGHLLSKVGWDNLCLRMKYEEPRPAMDGKPAEVKPRTSIGFEDPRQVDGELLWPEVYTPTRVATMEVNMGLYHSAAQLQQRPAPRGGGKFKREWFKVLAVCPPLNRIIRYWDKAGTKDGLGARTAGVLLGEYTDNSVGLAAMRTKYIFLDVIAGRWEAAEREAVILQTAQADRQRWGNVHTRTEQEPGSGGKESAQGTVGNLVGFSSDFVPVTGSKEVRADPLASQSSVGKVTLLAGDWNGDFLEELELFPVGKRKDKVDAGAGAFNYLVAPGGAVNPGDISTGAAGLQKPFDFERVDMSDNYEKDW